ncbi:ester cyclase [Bradyrhizobium niftali]|jgi:predicted ester cyclase|uniref:Ester cyclase n=2 Tax=Bradyrhizobium niftali TaxID=2560055 RepID=A0A4Y9LQX9_9BRAD|nr:ester cyclase [Bradyrhizobium niftali]
MTSAHQLALNEEIVRELYTCIQANRADRFEALVSTEHVDHSNGRHGPAGFAAAVANLHNAYSNFRIELETVVAADDLVVIQWHETGLHTGQFFNLKPTNQPFEARGLNMYRLAHGKIVDSWIAVDPKTFRAQQLAQATLRDAT